MVRLRTKLLKNKTLPITLTFFFIMMGLFGAYYAYLGQMASLANEFQKGYDLQAQAFIYNFICVFGLGKMLAWFIARMYQPWGWYKYFLPIGVFYAGFSLFLNYAFGGLLDNIIIVIVSYAIYIAFFMLYYRFHRPEKIIDQKNPKRIIKRERDRKVGL